MYPLERGKPLFIEQSMASRDLVSVIIPNFNHARYLGDAIQSVLKQDYSAVEIIVVDDGSTDDSRAVVAAFGDQVRYIWQQNRGLSAARNTGIQAAAGTYIAVLDADDLYEPTFVSTLVARLEEDPTADGIYCGYQFVDLNNRRLPQIEARSIPAKQLHEALISGNFLVPEAMFLRRHCYEHVGPFDETLRACEDWDMWLSITHSHRVVGTNKVLIRHRVLPGSMSTHPGRMLKNRMKVLAKHFGPEPTDGGPWSDAQRRAYGHGYLTSTVEYMQDGDLDGAYHCLRKMAEIYPALLVKLDTFYELGCGAQPKGYRTHFASLDLQRSNRELFYLLERLFAESDSVVQLDRYQHIAYGQAYYVLGLLSYGAGELSTARFFLLRALSASPSCALNQQFFTTLLKSLAGRGTLSGLRLLRRGLQLRSMSS